MLLLPSPAPGKRGALRALDERESSARTALRLQPVEPRRFVELARAMGIPSHDAARQVMEILETRAMLSPCESRINGR
jgi:hypothetical protein